MIRSEFVIQDNKILSFSVEGHSGLADRGEDILCASVSAMSQLVINTLTEVFGAELDLLVDEKKPLIRCTLKSVSKENKTGAEGILYGFYIQMKDIAEIYSAHLTVRTKS
ncbi:MAG: ribosomal-processing cysteine protease Prp [Clostridia bacterium]|nr:ribosomal-processing cysteine protease Prp [Clostridia bacterium]